MEVNTMTVFQVLHDYDTDGGFGDAVPCSDVVVTFENKKDAEAFVKTFAKPIVYDKPYSKLHCGVLRINEVHVTTHDELWKFHRNQFWWLSCDNIEEA